MSRYKEFEVEMWAFAKGAIRQVRVPMDEIKDAGRSGVLEAIFKYGQNDFQPVAGMPSVSVGDVIRLYGSRWRVVDIGFKEEVPGEECQHRNAFPHGEGRRYCWDCRRTL